MASKRRVSPGNSPARDTPASEPVQPAESDVRRAVNPPREGPALRFPVVGIGASAGGLDAYTQLLSALPHDTGMAFVLISHLSPAHVSMLSEILGRVTRMPVLEVSDEPEVRPNHVYVIPPARNMTIRDGRLHLIARTGLKGSHRPIDLFLDALAEEQLHQAIGVILSGTGNDGTVGLQHIKAYGGITFAQDDSAQHGGMPQSAINSGQVDFVLSPAGIADELVRISRHAHLRGPNPLAGTADRAVVLKILQLMHDGLGVDFSEYKANTLARRITRRMAMQKAESPEEYLELLRGNRAELEALYHDILINVTSFFRNPESFEHFQQVILPRLLEGRERNDPLRIWVLGCSTGEEAYSIAIVVAETLEQMGRTLPVQIFATDLNATGIEKARTGLYSRNIVDHVSPARLSRYFVESSSGYSVVKTIRDMCVFAQHDGLLDPPFSRMDVIACRNLLIYFEASLQQRVLPVLHFALKPGGILWLGSAESPSVGPDLFTLEEARFRFYRKVATEPHVSFGGPFSAASSRFGESKGARASDRIASRGVSTAQQDVDRLLINRYAPPGVLLNQAGEVLQYRGDTGRYLAAPPGKPTLQILKMLREGLLVAVRIALMKVQTEGMAVRRDGVRVQTERGRQLVDIELIPLPGRSGVEPSLLLLFHEQPSQPADASPGARKRRASADPAELESLKLELESTREYLQSVIEQQELANQELAAAHEEVLSTNEELQSINEEMETSKEEIQSTGEELTTVNDELQMRNAELSRSNNDLLNLISSVGMAMIMLDPQRRIRRFTPTAEGMFNLIQADIGRPIGHININLDLPALDDIVGTVLATGESQQFEVLDRQGCWKQLRASAYRAGDGSVDGVVLLLVDIDALKRDELTLRANEARLRIIHDQAPVGIYELDARGNFRRVNQRLCAITGYDADVLTGKRFSEITHFDDLSQIEEGFGRLQSGEVGTYRAEKRYVRPDGTVVWVDVHRFGVRDADGSTFVVGLVEDITARVLADDLSRQREARFRELADGTPVLMWASGPNGFEFVNQAYMRFVGCDEQQLRGEGWKDFLHPDDRPGVVKAYSQAVADHAPFERQFRYRAADGHYRWMMSVAVPRFDARGDANGHLGSTFDIGDFKEAEAILIEADQAKNAFIAMLAHELRNPIAALVNTAEIMASPSVSEERMTWAHSVLRRQLKNLTRMVDDLLEISRVTQGRIRLQPTTVELTTVLRRSAEMFLSGHEDGDIALAMDLPDAPILLHADSLRLEQIFVNLLNNAFKFTPGGGHVHVSVAMPQNGQKPCVEVIVRDDGEGIEEPMLQRIFEPFVQVDTSGGRAHQGLGIGLSLVKSLAELHGGSVRATSHGRNKGSAFIVSLPLPPSGV